MVFSSPKFILFLAVVLVVLATLPRTSHRKVFLAVASCFFYAAWDWRYVFLLAALSVKDYLSAKYINSAQTRSQARGWLVFSIASSLGCLGFFKYSDFVLANINSLAELSGIEWRTRLLGLLPVAGISFYVFKTMSYVVDVYRGNFPACRSWLDYTTFITFFPELIAGPIVRASIFLPQLDRDIRPTMHRLRLGLFIFSQGLIKKILLADRLATVADPVFKDPSLFSASVIWYGTLAYSLQIYFDFSGYSDMAIGTAKMIGLDLPENFRAPYNSRNITEFWRRWHMTLSSWLRDYLYIPLGGNRKGHGRTYLNLTITMLLGGLWHGASWNFVLWGGMHGLALAIHKYWMELRDTAGPQRFPLIGWAITQLFVVLAWVPFRSGSIAHTLLIWQKMILFDAEGYGWTPFWFFAIGTIAVAAHMVVWRTERRGVPHIMRNSMGWELIPDAISGDYIVPSRITVSGVFVVSVITLMFVFFAPFNTNPFIYFQF